MHSICDISHCSRFAQSKNGGLCRGHYYIKWHGDDPELRHLPMLNTDDLFCKIDYCDNPQDSHGLCKHHYSQARFGFLEIDGIEPNPECTFDGCYSKSKNRKGGYCRLHYEMDRDGKGLRRKRHWSRQDGECDARNCSKPAHSRGYCAKHYEAYVTTRQKRPNPKAHPCAVLNCTSRTDTEGGYCQRHKNQFTQHGLTWTGNAVPLELRPICLVDNCSNLCSQIDGRLCPSHLGRAKKYGLSVDEFLEIFRKQECAVCGSISKLVIDHDHSTGAVRGMLCNSCNTALGFMGESVERLQGLIDYKLLHG